GWGLFTPFPSTTAFALALEPIQEVRIQEQWGDLIKRRSMIRIMARRTNAAAVRAERSQPRARGRLWLIHANVRSPIHRLGRRPNRSSSLRLTIARRQGPCLATAAAGIDTN